MKVNVCAVIGLLVLPPGAAAVGEDVPIELRRWLAPQTWQWDVDGPIVSLGTSGQFDDTHIFAPAVAEEAGRYRLWYCGSTGAVAKRVFQLGLATSSDGRLFEKHSASPVLDFGDGKHSILTPTLLRNPDGTVLRENGKLRMWFSSTDFQDKSGLHTLHEVTSNDGIEWSKPSPVELQHVYAPTVIKTGRHYQMWYVDVSQKSWVIRHASSQDGRKWRVTPEPVIVRDQNWERDQLFYPTVVRIDGAYLMWYGSYWNERQATTGLGCAVSLDGLKWYKHPQNPVLRPDPSRPWESNYVTSQSVIRLADGSFRIWYASRKKPPFVNKYFAINTAKWTGPPKEPQNSRGLARFRQRSEFDAWKQSTRQKLRTMLGIPKRRVPLAAERRGEFEHDGIVVEKWVFTSEPGSRVPAVLYRPQGSPKAMPAIVLTYGHGGSKSQWQYNYAGQVYARLGLACLAIDPIGEEERHVKGRLGTRAHDPKAVHERADAAGRLIMGKLVFDTMRGVDFLMQREDIDHDRIGVAGNSLGGATAGWMAALEPRIKMAIVSGWAYEDVALRTKYCTKAPNQRMREICSWPEYAALAVPDCALLIMNGDADWVIDRDDDGSAWLGTRRVFDEAAELYEQFGDEGRAMAWFEPRGGHRPYFVYKEALTWIHEFLGTPGWTHDRLAGLPTVNSGDWCDANKVALEPLYGTALHQRGATLPELHLRRIPREKLSCLKPGELGSDAFTVDGWLRQIERRKAMR